MSFIPKNCVCPYCKTIYRYGSIKKIMSNKKESCYHCKKIFYISKKGFLWLALEMLAVYALLNFFAINVMQSLNFLSLLLLNTLPAIAAILLLPLYIELTKTEKEKEKK